MLAVLGAIELNMTINTLLFWIVILLSAIVLWQAARSTNTRPQTAQDIAYSEFLSQVNAGKVGKITISRTRADGVYRDGGAFSLTVPASQEQMLTALQQKGVEIWFSDTSTETSQWSWLVNLVPLVLLAALWFFMIRRMQAKRSPAAEGPSTTSGGPWRS